MTEKRAFHVNGYLGIIVALAVLFVSGWMILAGFYNNQVGSVIIGVLLLLISLFIFSSLTIVAPNQAKVLTFFGRYVGSIRDAGLYVTIPLTNKATLSLRVRNFNSEVLKVNDSKGNPVEIAAVIVFKVVDSAKASFDVDQYEQFVEIQSESAIRHVATEYPYDTFEDDAALSLRGNPDDVSNHLTKELQDRLQVAGVQIIETRLTHLAYATEIANAMLQRQQASAILSARKIIVQGAVSMTEDAIDQLENDTTIKLDDERKLQLINNMLVSIITDRGTQPVINTDNVQR
ncbi:SPFH domain-containing protein [Paucilactobacillus kaifaensis]|uniref:SPFH domain-containing protein n=1 Tax=Paucilactobacillus kaifaensis TaxID=2559921 RepID=UPI0010F7F8F1|nr:SPFH domain-containing protein [Paucilactobacillus kaifaensis]